eukprot:UN18446
MTYSTVICKIYISSNIAKNMDFFILSKGMVSLAFQIFLRAPAFIKLKIHPKIGSYMGFLFLIHPTNTKCKLQDQT